jgi:hypothetical protein
MIKTKFKDKKTYKRTYKKNKTHKKYNSQNLKKMVKNSEIKSYYLPTSPIGCNEENKRVYTSIHLSKIDKDVSHTYLFNDSISFDTYYLNHGKNIPIYKKIKWVVSSNLFPTTSNNNDLKKMGGNTYNDEYILYPSPFFERLRKIKINKKELTTAQIKNIIEKYDLSLFNIEHKKQNQLYLQKMFQNTEQKLAGILEGLNNESTNNNDDSKKKYKLTVTD